MGWKLTLFTACNAVFTISAFKYSIHYYQNSFEIDQFIITMGIAIFWFLNNKKKHNTLCKKETYKLMFLFFLSGAIATYLISWSYVLLNASVATALKRAGEMIFALIFGILFFHEKKWKQKIIFIVILSIGVFCFTL
ncbi:EamA family transporter [Candidatus Peregrinibacteria bacterium]|nr:EamA family transporter [Candidatus Peregrinibacteria bacterium]